MQLRTGTVVDATLIDAPSSPTNGYGKRNPEMRPSKKANYWSFGVQAHRGVAAESGLVLAVKTTAANLHGVTQAAELLHGDESVVFADAGYPGVEKRPEAKVRHPAVNLLVAMIPSKRRVLSDSPSDLIVDQIEQMKASVRGKAEHPFRVIKCQFGFRKVRYKGLAQNARQLLVMFALSNLWTVRKRILQVT